MAIGTGLVLFEIIFEFSALFGEFSEQGEGGGVCRMLLTSALTEVDPNNTPTCNCDAPPSCQGYSSNRQAFRYRQACRSHQDYLCYTIAAIIIDYL